MKSTFIGDSTFERLLDSILNISVIILEDEPENVENMEFWKFAFLTEIIDTNGGYYNSIKSNLHVNKTQDLILVSMFEMSYKLHISIHDLNQAVNS